VDNFQHLGISSRKTYGTCYRRTKAKVFYSAGNDTALVGTVFFVVCFVFDVGLHHTGGSLKYFGTADPNSAAFQEAGNWVGILFGIYNGISAVLALSLPVLAKRLSKKRTHAIALMIGGISLLSFLIFNDSDYLIIPMIGIGIAWASILSMPYAMLANSLPPRQMGMYMGLFNMSSLFRKL